ncbi:MAG: anti-sigma factor antagonist [Phycisphaerales bacterium]|nr:anti-sigma factor antagonist [Phycisphaerales bacterium]
MTPDTSDTSSTSLVTISPKNQHLIVRLHALSIGAREALAIVEEASRALEGATKGKRFVIDLSRTNSLSSMGLGLCVDLRNRAVDAGLKPAIAGMNVQLAELFHMMRVDRLFTIVSSAGELERILL